MVNDHYQVSDATRRSAAMAARGSAQPSTAPVTRDEERATLISSLQQITESLETTVSDAKRNFQSSGEVQSYISLDNPSGIRRLFAPMTVYANAISSVKCKTWKEVEHCLSSHYRDADVCEAVEGLLSAEDAYKDFVVMVETELIKHEEQCAVENAITVGDPLPPDMTLTSATDGQPVTLRSHWESSKYTLLILMRHFG